MVFYLFILWLITLLAAVCCLSKEEWHNKAKWYLCWALFPFPFILHPQRLGFIKSWLLFLISPFMGFVLFMVGCILVCIAMSQSEEGVPVSIPYHTAKDLKRITGVDFPEVIPVDSTYVDEWMYHKQFIKFVPRKVMTTSPRCFQVPFLCLSQLCRVLQRLRGSTTERNTLTNRR